MSGLGPTPGPPTTAATRILDWNDLDLVASMESEAYGAFAGGTSSALLRGLWIWDDAARRVRTRVPPEDQRAWVEVDGRRVHTAIIVNTRLAVLQSAAFGFGVPAELEGRGICEFTLAFSRLDHSIGHFHAAWDQAFRGLRSMGFHEGFATCARRLLPLYRRMGARVLAEVEIGGEVRYFLHFNLERTSRWNERVMERDDRPASGEGTDLAGLNDGLALARRETGIVLARVLVALEIARGQPDAAFGIEARRAGAQHVLATVRRVLAAPLDADRSEAIRIARDQVEDVDQLWDAVSSIARQSSPGCFAEPASPMSLIVESLHLLIVSLLDAWDGDATAGALVERLARGDHEADLSAAAEHLRALGHGESADEFDRLRESFARSASAIARIASRLVASAPGAGPGGGVA